MFIVGYHIKQISESHIWYIFRTIIL